MAKKLQGQDPAWVPAEVRTDPNRLAEFFHSLATKIFKLGRTKRSCIPGFSKFRLPDGSPFMTSAEDEVFAVFNIETALSQAYYQLAH